MTGIPTTIPSDRTPERYVSSKIKQIRFNVAGDSMIALRGTAPVGIPAGVGNQWFTSGRRVDNPPIETTTAKQFRRYPEHIPDLSIHASETTGRTALVYSDTFDPALFCE
jgi:hypothetical protein